MLIKGMFPGIQTVEEDDEFDILNMPLLNSDDVGFYTPRTFHVDVRAAMKYVPLERIAEAVRHVTEPVSYTHLISEQTERQRQVTAPSILKLFQENRVTAL